MKHNLFRIFIFFTLILKLKAQKDSNEVLMDVKWCAPSVADYRACERLRDEMSKDDVLEYGRIRVHSVQGSPAYAAKLICIQAHNIFECAEFLLAGAADVARVPAEALYGISTNSDFNDLVPIAAGETAFCDQDANVDCHAFTREYTVAVVKKSSAIRQLSDMRDRRVCFGSVGSTSGWIIPIYKLLANWTGSTNIPPINTFPTGRTLPPIPPLPTDRFRATRPSLAPLPTRRPPPPLPTRRSRNKRQNWEKEQCPLDFNVAYDVFPRSCAPGRWAMESVFGKDFSYRLCSSCSGFNSSCLTSVLANNPLNCLRSDNGEIAFVSNLELKEWLKNNRVANHYNLLCRSGTENVYRSQTCHWGAVSGDVFLASTAPSKQYSAKVYGSFVQKLFSTAKENFYASKGFVTGNQRWNDVQRLDQATAGFSGTPSMKTYLQKAAGDVFYKAMTGSFPKCNKDSMRLCLLSREELEKCENIKMAFSAAALPDQLQCIVGYSADNCVQMINNNKADLVVMEAHRADHYTHKNKVLPILSEVFGNVKEYALAVSLSNEGRIQRLADLKSGLHNVCSAGTDSYSGWEAPNRAFKATGVLSAGACKLNEAWARLFRTSCVPGAQNATVTLGRNPGDPIDKKQVAGLCASCTGGPGSCLTPAESTDHGFDHQTFDNYYGDIGALRCLIRRKGDVAFVSSSALFTMVYLHQTKRDDDFRAIDLTNFNLLCGNGQTMQPASSESISKCNLGPVPERWMVTRPNTDQTQLTRWQNLWILASERARNNFDWFKTHTHLIAGRTDHLTDMIFTNITVGFERFSMANMTEAEYHKMAYDDLKNPFLCGGTASYFSISILALLIVTLYHILHFNSLL